MSLGLTIKNRIVGFLEEKGFIKYRQKVHEKVRLAYSKAIKETSTETKREMKSKATRAFKVKKKTFLNTFSSHIYDNNKDKLASVLFLQRIKYFKIHEEGGTINGKMVLPFENFGKRMTSKKWKATLKQLQQNKQTFWKNINGKLILFAKTDTSNNRALSAYRKTYRANNNNVKKIQKGTAIPIGMLVTNIRLKRRYPFTNIVNNFAPERIIKNFDKNLDL